MDRAGALEVDQELVHRIGELVVAHQRSGTREDDLRQDRHFDDGLRHLVAFLLAEFERKFGETQFQHAATVLDQQERQEFLGNLDLDAEILRLLDRYLEGFGRLDAGEIIYFVNFLDGACIGQEKREQHSR